MIHTQKSRPRLLDLFCGAGGAAMGYHRAGFEVVGVDIKPQPHYPFEFIEHDALDFLDFWGADDFNAIHASPPCQAYSRLLHLPWLKGRSYPKLIVPTRERLQRLRLPYVIENVMDAPLDPAIVLCGSTLGLPLSRHRLFELSHWMLAPQCNGHPTIEPGRRSMATRYKHSNGTTGVIKEINRDSIAGHIGGIDRAKRAMGIDWMNGKELVQAIPPAYTEWIGRQLLAHLEVAA